MEAGSVIITASLPFHSSSIAQERMAVIATHLSDEAALQATLSAYVDGYGWLAVSVTSAAEVSFRGSSGSLSGGSGRASGSAPFWAISFSIFPILCACAAIRMRLKSKQQRLCLNQASDLSGPLPTSGPASAVQVAPPMVLQGMPPTVPQHTGTGTGTQVATSTTIWDMRSETEHMVRKSSRRSSGCSRAGSVTELWPPSTSQTIPHVTVAMPQASPLGIPQVQKSEASQGMIALATAVPVGGIHPPFASANLMVQPNPNEELERLVALFTSGALTETEFEEAKARALGLEPTRGRIQIPKREADTGSNVARAVKIEREATHSMRLSWSDAGVGECDSDENEKLELAAISVQRVARGKLARRRNPLGRALAWKTTCGQELIASSSTHGEFVEHPGRLSANPNRPSIRI